VLVALLVLVARALEEAPGRKIPATSARRPQ
jgi:hypothetical protein